ncbi:hypothetical protein BATMR_06460 [Bacillus altitudinis]|uniref:hypothetical protein n=1 Tax=Bacillus altitudinis TaxID=293387 RepID=UPI000C237D15|nr:hypothetical protein [Bacillus altitudinis]MDN0040379.1 hypothetical protein [Bacillus aerophilus]PJI14017.1 hypothetical protein CTV96_02715 [Bacillus altitudinis]PKQ86664.1 hypothetical protein CTV98_000665 [Bacillus altitudinis]GJI57618.1 hypothetical protein BATMR_06460 [Bacillus altitudinis]
MVKNEVNFLFNTNRALINNEVSHMKNDLPNVLYSAPDMLVYHFDCFNVTIDSIGTVLFSSNLESKEIKEKIPVVIKEYIRLSQLDDMFSRSKDFKIIASKNMKKDVIDELIAMRYYFKSTDVNDSIALSVVH